MTFAPVSSDGPNRSVVGTFRARLAWFYENRGDLVEQVSHFLQTQDYLIYRLSDQAALDHSIACCSLLAYLQRPEYWLEMLAVVGADVKTLSRIVPPGHIVGDLKPDVATALGLPSGIPVIAAAMDATCGALAIHSVAPDSVAETTGSALVIGVTCDAPLLDPQIHIPCFVHALPGEIPIAAMV